MILAQWIVIQRTGGNMSVHSDILCYKIKIIMLLLFTPYYYIQYSFFFADLITHYISRILCKQKEKKRVTFEETQLHHT